MEKEEDQTIEENNNKKVAVSRNPCGTIFETKMFKVRCFLAPPSKTTPHHYPKYDI